MLSVTGKVSTKCRLFITSSICTYKDGYIRESIQLVRDITYFLKNEDTVIIEQL